MKNKQNPIKNKSKKSYKHVGHALLALLTLLPIFVSAETFQYGQFSFSFDETLPGWIKPVDPKASSGSKQGQNTEYALIDNQILADPGNFQRYYAQSSYLHTSQAVAEASEIQIMFNPEYQQLQIHDVSVIRNGRKLGRFDSRAVRLLQREEDLQRGIYDGVVTANITVADTRVGDRLDFSYTISGRNPVYGSKIFGAYPIGWAVDVGQVQLRVVADKQIKIRYQVHNIDLKVRKRKLGGFREYVWKADSVPATKDEEDNPVSRIIYPWVEYTEYEDWREVEQWARSLYEKSNVKSDEIDEISSTLLQDDASNSGYTKNALFYVQNEIRYLGLELGENSHLPRSPAEVLKNRYGDCKDKTNLLVSLLEAYGIESYPTLVSTQLREGIKDLLPSPNAFDHVIVKAVVDNKTVWIDPTKTFQQGSLATLGFTPYGTGLVIGQEFKDPIEDITPLPGQMGKIEMLEHFIVTDINKPAALKVETTYSGEMADQQRYVFSSNPPDKIEEYYLNFYAKTYIKITSAEKLKSTDDKANNTFTITENYVIDDLFSQSDGIFSMDIYSSLIGENLVNPKTVKRRTALRIGDPKYIRHKVIVDFEPDVNLVVDGTPLAITTKGFYFGSRSAFYSGRFEYDSNLSVTKSWLDVDDAEKYISDLTTIRDDINFSLNFVYPYKKEVSKPYRRLIKELKKHASN